MGLAVKVREKYMVKRLFENINIMRRLLSSAHISAIEQNIQVKLNLRGNQAMIEGDKLDVDLVDNLLGQFYELIRQGYPVYPSDIEYGIRLLQEDAHINLKDIFLDTVYIVSKKRVITPKT
ncbi:MAG: phosphate starvation-inducible protein PhoH, partial [Candidatus Desulfofervidus sp.]|nr:phosphate starvation-inducible protein PhoH [Candidatus Desulfofervidus sp.]